MKVQVEGEVITSDEFVGLLEEQKASKDTGKKKKGKRENRNKGTISLHVRIVKMLRKVGHIMKKIFTHALTFKIYLGF